MKQTNKQNKTHTKPTKQNKTKLKKKEKYESICYFPEDSILRGRRYRKHTAGRENPSLILVLKYLDAANNMQTPGHRILEIHWVPD